MRALVVGGAGFIGSSLVERLLAEDWHVEVVDDLSTGSLDRLAAARADAAHKLRIHRHDVADATTADLVERAAPDRVFFLADGAGEPDPVHRVEVGVVGLVRVLEGAGRLAEPPKVVVTLAATELYGPGSSGAPAITEDSDTQAVGAGGAAALGALAALRAYRVGASIEHTALILPDVYGPSMPPRGDLGIAVRHAAGVLADRSYDLVHLDDTVDALVRAASRADGLVVNISSGAPVQGTDVVGMLAGAGVPMALDDQRRATPPPLLDPARAELHLGWRPFTELASGLQTLK